MTSTRSRVGAQMRRALAPGPQATGTPAHRDGHEVIVFRRVLPTSVERTWSLLTDPELTPRWIGSWRGDPRSGVIEVRADGGGGEGTPVTYDIERLERGRLLQLTMRSQGERVPWRLRIDLAEQGAGTVLDVAQSLADPAFAPLVGAACDFYLDRLVAVAQGGDPTALSYEDYFVGQADHYRGLFPGQRATATYDT